MSKGFPIVVFGEAHTCEIGQRKIDLESGGAQ